MTLLARCWSSALIGDLAEGVILELRLTVSYRSITAEGGGSRESALFHVVMAENHAFPLQVKR